jgi:hypothetical protein
MNQRFPDCGKDDITMNLSDTQADDPIPVILNIDVEPDEFLVDIHDPQPWRGFEFCQSYLTGLREKFAEATGCAVHFNWMLRMDPQIAIAYGSGTWAVDSYGDFLARCRAAGDHIGLHVHNYRWSKELNGWLDDSASVAWMTECLETAVQSFSQAFGTPATSLRFGNYWQSTEAVNCAEKLGIRYDLSIEPGVLSKRSVGGRVQTGVTPSFTRVPRVPYVPATDNFRRPLAGPVSRSITLIPLTSAYLKLGYSPRDIRSRVGRLLRNGRQGRWQSTPLAMLAEWGGENTFSNMLTRALARQASPYLAFAIRSNINQTRLARIDPCMQALLDLCRDVNLRFCTPEETMALLGGAAQDQSAAGTMSSL